VKPKPLKLQEWISVDKKDKADRLREDIEKRARAKTDAECDEIDAQCFPEVYNRKRCPKT
jgi:hypothetical protein